MGESRILALDALTLLRFDAVAEEHALVMLDQVRARLESRRNTEQPYGDFGMLCAWPPFRDRDALRAKVGFPPTDTTTAVTGPGSTGFTPPNACAAD